MRWALPGQIGILLRRHIHFVWKLDPLHTSFKKAIHSARRRHTSIMAHHISQSECSIGTHLSFPPELSKDISSHLTCWKGMWFAHCDAVMDVFVVSVIWKRYGVLLGKILKLFSMAKSFWFLCRPRHLCFEKLWTSHQQNVEILERKWGKVYR